MPCPCSSPLDIRAQGGACSVGFQEATGKDIADLQTHVNELNALRRTIDRGEFMEWDG